MRQLRLVGPGAPGTDLIVLETVDGDEQFALPVDAELRDAVRADLPRLSPPPAPPAPPKPPAPTISPREIQMRVRAGESPDEVAADTGASPEWIARFAAPVLAERTRIADEARRARARRSGPDGELVVFGETVEARFAAHGVDPAGVTWDAHRREDAQWELTARWVGGSGEHTAAWIFHLTSGRLVTPADDTAADLLSDRPIRPVVAPVPAHEPALSLAPPAAPGVVAFPAMPDAHTGPLPRPEEVFDQDRAARSGHPSRLPAPVDAAPDAPSRPPVPLLPAAQLDEPPLPLGLPDPPVRFDTPTGLRSVGRGRRGSVPAETEEEKAARAHIPSWDDILLGVRRKQD